jgi:preprotein translocase subunit SecF
MALAVAAIIANLHDVVIILGFFAFFQWEFSLPVLAAVLAVLGYSVNESVVIADRSARISARCARPP